MGKSKLPLVGHARRRAALAVSFAVAAAFVLAACGGGGSKSSSGNASQGGNSSGSGNVTAFCSDYVQGANEYQQSGGDPTDQAYFAFQTSMKKAQDEAPAAVKSDVTAIVNAANKAQNSKYNGDVTQYSQRINAWAASNCPSTTTTTDASAGSAPTDTGSCVTDDTGNCATTTTNAASGSCVTDVTGTCATTDTTDATAP